MKKLDEMVKAKFDELCSKKYNDKSVFDELIRIQNFVDCEFEDGNTPLLAALHHTNINPYLIQDLINKSDLQRTDKAGKTPLEIALERKEYFVAYLLIKNGAKLNASFDTFSRLYEIFNQNTFVEKDLFIFQEIKKYLESVKNHKFSSIEFELKSDDLTEKTAQKVAQSIVDKPQPLIEDAANNGFQIVPNNIDVQTHSHIQESAPVVQSEDVEDQSDLTPISQLLKAMVEGSEVNLDINYRKTLHEKMNWTALRTKKVSVTDLTGIATVLSDIHKEGNSKNSLKLYEYSPNVQNALFNIVAYAGKLATEKPSKFGKLNNIKDDKYNATIEFLKSVLNGELDSLEAKVQEYMNNPAIKASRGSKFYKLHGLFSGKGFNVQSTMQELFHDLNKVLEEENSHDSMPEL